MQEDNDKIYFAKTVGDSYQDTAVRELQSANSSINSIAGHLMNIAGGAIGLVSAYIINQRSSYCRSKVALLLLLLSLAAGILQKLVDYKFFINHSQASSKIATHATMYAAGTHSEKHIEAVRSGLEEKGKLSPQSSLLPISIQILFIIIAVYLLASELIF